MAKIATSKQTGGGGFDFEDKVSAYFLSKLLSGNFALDSSIGTLTNVEYQVRPDGWLIDDLLLTFHDGRQNHRVAVSAKSNRQITATGLPDDIVKDIWTQFLNVEKILFDQNHDYLLFVVSPIARSVSENLTKLIQSAKNTDPAILAKRVRTKAFSKQQQSLFDSFKCPLPLHQANMLFDKEICVLLSRLIVVEFDFQNIISKDENLIISELQAVLRSNAQAESIKLYNRLKGIRADIAPHGGSLNYLQLIAKIINDFELITQPEYQSDWKKIADLTDLKIANIPDKIGNKFVIERPIQIERIRSSLEEERFVFFTGKSGFGKTVVAKHLAQKVIAGGRKVIWLDGELLQSNAFKVTAGIAHDIAEMVTSTNNLGNLIIVDGADRFFKENIIENFVPFIRMVAGLDPLTWKMVITCQSEDYEALLKQIHRKNVFSFNSKTLELQPAVAKELLPSAKFFPQLISLFKHDHLLALLGNLKYLDLVAFHIGHSDLKSLAGRIGESNLIDWIWQHEILENGEHGYVHSRFLQELAIKQANMLTVYTPVTDFRIEESAAITGLKRMKVIGDTADRLFFIHDLFGDWARYKTIRSKGNDVKGFLLNLDLASPLWGKAIRLYGIYLLEKEENASAWLNFFKGFSMSESKPKLIRTLLLEAVIFSNSTFLYLEELWPEFKNDNGALMNQFFEQFLIRGTAPDPSILKLAATLEGITLSEIASQYRLPVYNYWFPVLRFVKDHSVDLLQFSRGHILKIVTTWLDTVPLGSDFRNDMARIAVDVTRWLMEQKDNSVMVYSKAATAIYDPMLKSFSELPDDVENLSLELARRKEYTPTKSNKHDEDGPWRFFNDSGAIVLPNEFAPNRDVDDDFRKVCLESGAINTMISLSPTLAKDILMAVLLQIKGARERSTTPTYGLYDIHGWFPPFYTRGPFISFLVIDETQGINLIIELTNIAAKNWKHQLKHEQETAVISLTFQDGIKQDYFGDERIYFWFRDAGNAPHSLVSALMALERHLLLRLDKEEDITTAIQLILEKSTSVSLLGLLSSLGRHKEYLFLSILKPMLGEISFLHWEMMLPLGAHNIEGHQMIGAELLGLNVAKRAYEWHKMPHRSKSIQQVAHLLLFNNGEIRKYFEENVLPKWVLQRDELEINGYIDPYLDNMIGQFNIENYVTVQHEDNYTLEYREPQKITEKLQHVRKDDTSGGSMEGFAFKISQDLEQQKKYTLHEIDSIWQKIQSMNTSLKGEQAKFLNDPIANVFAAVAVIILNWCQLETSRPDYIDWAINQLDDATALEKYNDRHMDSIPLNQSAEIFQALTIPVLYKNLPNVARIRKITANFTLKASYPLISKLFESLGRIFQWNAPSFIRIQNLYIERCHLIHNLNASVWDRSNIDYDTLFNPSLVEFVGNIKDQPALNLSTYRKQLNSFEEAPKKRKHGIYYSKYNDPGLDIHAFYHAFSKMPAVSETATTEVDKVVLSHYHMLVDLITYMWGDINDERLPLDEDLYEFDKWLAFRFAKLLTTQINIEEARSIWQPLMAYGNFNHRWLEEFTFQMLYANKDTSQPQTLGLHWNDMIDFAFTVKTWGSDRRFDNEASLWESLLGISNIGLEIWSVGYVSIITTISTQLIKWFTKQVHNSSQIKRLCKLLKAPCVDIFLNSGVLIVNVHLKFQISLNEAEVPTGFVRAPFKYDDEVASMCSNLWERRRIELTHDAGLFEAFKEIVVYLVARQNITGLELQDRLLSI
jgi:hypothetical protein